VSGYSTCIYVRIMVQCSCQGDFGFIGFPQTLYVLFACLHNYHYVMLVLGTIVPEYFPVKIKLDILSWDFSHEKSIYAFTHICSYLYFLTLTIDIIAILGIAGTGFYLGGQGHSPS